jgi:hypothetical protein
MVCAHCGQDNRQEAKFCRACALPLAVSCSVCGSQVNTVGSFCDNCGSRLAGEHVGEKLLKSPPAISLENGASSMLEAWGDVQVTEKAKHQYELAAKEFEALGNDRSEIDGVVERAIEGCCNDDLQKLSVEDYRQLAADEAVWNIVTLNYTYVAQELLSTFFENGYRAADYDALVNGGVEANRAALRGKLRSVPIPKQNVEQDHPTHPIQTSVPRYSVTRVDNSLAWTLAFAPLIGVAVALGLSSSDPAIVYYGWAATWAINVILAYFDERRVKASDDLRGTSFGLWAWLLVPMYLFKRSKALAQSTAIPAVWCVCFVSALAVGALLPSIVGVPIDKERLETEISAEIKKQINLMVAVECPNHVRAKAGDSFQCIATASDGSRRLVDVRIQNSDGDIVWQVQ